jgi:surface polysaccharide O-acyltransferase-like enzyme
MTRPEPDNQKNKDSVSLPADLIRTIGIVLVILLHASNEYYGAIVRTPLETNVYWWTTTVYKSIAIPCVPLFIMLSGTLLLRSSKVNEPIRVFLKKRLSRIGLAFLFWGAVYLAWAFFITGNPVTFSNVTQGIVKGLFTGPYYHFWFLYVIAGLYLITPILRAVVGFGERKILRYLVVLWLVGIAIIPPIQLVAGFNILNVFVIGGWIGYFVLGTYLQRVHVRSSVLYGLLAAGIVWTIMSTWAMNFAFSGLGQYNFFMDDLSANVLLASVALFMILSKVSADWPGSKHPNLSKFVHAISINTLPIYLFHIIILESLQKGFFGFKLSLTVINPIIEVPLLTAITLLITLGLVLVMKKIPIIKKLIG